MVVNMIDCFYYECAMQEFDHEVLMAISKVAKKHGIFASGSCFPVSLERMDTFKIKVTASPEDDTRKKKKSEEIGKIKPTWRMAAMLIKHSNLSLLHIPKQRLPISKFLPQE